MRAELESRRQQGLLSSPVPSEGSCVSCKEKNYVSPDNYYLEKKNKEVAKANNVGASNPVENTSYVASVQGDDHISPRNEEQSDLTGPSSKEKSSLQLSSKEESSTRSGIGIPDNLNNDSTETRPAKRFKQDSGGTAGDTEPFDFCGGDD